MAVKNIRSFPRVLLTTLCVALTLFAGLGASASDAPGPAAQQIENFHEGLMNSTRLENDYDVRAKALGETIDAVFDLERIARISVGREWRALDKDARAEYVNRLRAVVIGTWVSRFDADRGQQLVIKETREVKSGRHVVRTNIIRPGGKVAVLDYYLRAGRVINVVADGVSDLSLRRADYAAILAASQFSGLLAHLHKQEEAARETFVAAANNKASP